VDYADILLLGLWNRPVPQRILDSCQHSIERGLVRHLALSTHRRSLVPQLAQDKQFSVFHVRYNAVHRGAESEVFARMPLVNPPGLVSFTATSWRQLLDPSRAAGETKPTASDCYRFVLTQPAVNVCLSGPANAAQVREALDALQRGPMCAEELAWMRRVGDAIYKKSHR
jgi:aryl-alcohol dehydrogenase-like predicted oxidoreductase